jgi:Uma2 family endonuclease
MPAEIVYCEKEACIALDRGSEAFPMAQSIKSDPPQEHSLLAHPPRLPANTTYEEFLEWADEDTLAEWVDGVIVMTSPASLRHQEIAKFLITVFSTFCEVHGLGKVIFAPFQMKLKGSGREPDILFVAKDHLGRFKKTYLDGPADLVVEIVSPEGKGRDGSDKVAEYSEAGIPEYWLIDPILQQAMFYQLDESRSYQPATLDEGGIYPLAGAARLLAARRMALARPTSRYYGCAARD